MNTITLGEYQVGTTLQSLQPVDDAGVEALDGSGNESRSGYVGTGTDVAVALPDRPREYYRHGWQSWSLAAWLPVDCDIPTPRPRLLHPLQYDPAYVSRGALHGSWVGAVRLGHSRVLLLGALQPDAHVELHGAGPSHSAGGGASLHGWYEPGHGGRVHRDETDKEQAGASEWFVGLGPEDEVFSQYAALLAARLGSASGKTPPRVWCSWYSYYASITEERLHETFAALADLPFDVLQVDDGWQRTVGDWQPNADFPSGMGALAGQIRQTGRTAGLWLAPLVVTASSPVSREHPEWLVHDEAGTPVSGGFNWNEDLYAIDTTHPGARDWLARLMGRVRAWGYDYLKLDFLYAAALPGRRYRDVPREAAYREGLEVLRNAMGEDAYFLTCGAPVLPSLGLCDALRVGPDVAGHWESRRDAELLANPAIPGTRNAIRTTIHRLWLAPLVSIDPDVAYFSDAHTELTADERRLLRDLAHVCHYKATSDLPHRLTEGEREELVTFLETEPEVRRRDRYRYEIGTREVDFSGVVPLPPPARGLRALAGRLLGWLAGRRWILRLLASAGERRAHRQTAGPP